MVRASHSPLRTGALLLAKGTAERLESTLCLTAFEGDLTGDQIDIRIGWVLLRGKSNLGRRGRGVGTAERIRSQGDVNARRLVTTTLQVKPERIGDVGSFRILAVPHLEVRLVQETPCDE
jgi:hypothetical protein